MPWPVFLTQSKPPDGGSSSILSTIKDGLDVAKSGAEVYGTIQGARQRPAPTTVAPNADGGAHPVSVITPGRTAVTAAVVAVVLVAGFFILRAVSK